MKTRPGLPTELIFFVTSHCHLHCRHCFNWQNLQRGRDLSLQEIEALARSLPTLKNLMLSGGEPFLRKDLVEICRLFARHSRIVSIDIPTSGTLVDRTLAAVEEILRIEPAFYLSIGISLDGLEAYHDANRGVPGTFARAAECCDRLLELKKREKRLRINILTTLTGANRDELLALKRFVAERFPGVDNLYWGIARGDIREKAEGTISLTDLEQVDQEFLEHDNRSRGRRRNALLSRFYALRREAFVRRVQPVPCVAAKRIAVVYDDGSVAPCELLPPVGNLRESPFESLWVGSQMRQAREAIAAGQCSCTHECFLYPSFEAFLLQRPLTLFRLAGINGVVQWLVAKWDPGSITLKIRMVVGKLFGTAI